MRAPSPGYFPGVDHFSVAHGVEVIVEIDGHAGVLGNKGYDFTYFELVGRMGDVHYPVFYRHAFDKYCGMFTAVTVR